MSSPQYVAAIITRKKKALLLQRVKCDTEAGKWTPINETVKNNESPEQAVKRGVKEEIGMNFIIITRFEDHRSDGLTAIFLGEVRGTMVLNSKEATKFGWFSYAQTKHLRFAFDYDRVIKKLHKLKLID